mmetsp:Transcript_3596/g.11217  ORF Transcript_3596/g.11217 Transcript_3596/m.11217 type:complete len:211 (-) Transcript_3596:504-1136(-)
MVKMQVRHHVDLGRRLRTAHVHTVACAQSSHRRHRSPQGQEGQTSLAPLQELLVVRTQLQTLGELHVCQLVLPNAQQSRAQAVVRLGGVARGCYTVSAIGDSSVPTPKTGKGQGTVREEHGQKRPVGILCALHLRNRGYGASVVRDGQALVGHVHRRIPFLLLLLRLLRTSAAACSQNLEEGVDVWARGVVLHSLEESGARLLLEIRPAL